MKKVNFIDIIIPKNKNNGINEKIMVDMHMHTLYSDGDKKPNNEIGKGSGSLKIPKEYIEEWINVN